MRRSQGWVPVVLAVVALALVARPATGYVPATIDFVNGQAVTAQWDTGDFPVPVRVTPGLTTDLDAGTARAELDAAMATWNSVAGSSASIFVEREQDVEANVVDGINAIEFSNDAALDGSQFVALTFLLTENDGRIIEADMLVNDREVGFTNVAGSEVGFDLQTAMLKAVGKLLGLTNSPVGAIATGGIVDETSAVMFALSRGIGESARTLRSDDRAGIAAMYPTGQLASISGSVLLSGAPVFGAHVVAFDPLTDELVGALTLPDGSFHIGGLQAGRYLIEVLPLSAPATPATIGGIFADDAVNTSFLRVFYTETVRLSAGQQVTGVTVGVS